MSFQKGIFFEVPCLTEKSKTVSGLELQKKWFRGADKRYLAESLQKFIDYNRLMFEFLGVTPSIEGNGKTVELSFKTDKYMGAIPLRAPDTGKQIGDFVVGPRYASGTDKFSEYVEIVNLLETGISPEFKDSIPLFSSNSIRPPVYFDAVKYVKILDKAMRAKWNKFQDKEAYYNAPRAQINWDKYAKDSFDPQKRLSFPCKENTLTMLHDEYFNINYVYSLAKNELALPTTPQNIKSQIHENIQYLDKKLENFSEKETTELVVHNSDPLLIKTLKIQGNKILKRNSKNVTAWRVDLSVLFERYIQFILKSVSCEIGAIQLENYKIRNSSRPTAWSLAYLEPDIILIKNDLTIVVDAKYKSHLFNIKNNSEFLKNEHRMDLHQVLAYSSFNKNRNKMAILCYPNSEVTTIQLDYVSAISNIKNTLLLVGVPMKKMAISEVKNRLVMCISNAEKKQICE